MPVMVSVDFNASFNCRTTQKQTDLGPDALGRVHLNRANAMLEHVRGVRANRLILPAAALVEQDLLVIARFVGILSPIRYNGAVLVIMRFLKKSRRVWEAHFLGIEAAIALLLTGVMAVWIGVVDSAPACIDALLRDSRQDFYGRLATISGTMAGFGLALGSFVIPATVSSVRFRLILTSPYRDQLWKTYIQTVIWCGLLAVTALICLLADTDKSPSPWFLVPLALCGLLALARLGRSIWLLRLVIQVLFRPDFTDHPEASQQS